MCKTNNNDTSPQHPLSAEEEEVVHRLAAHAYHLPGYSWKQDWLQYFCNNHPLFAVCCQHKLHPISIWMRLAGVIGSVGFGLCLTNIVWLFFFYGKEEEPPLFTVSSAGVEISNSTQYKIYDENDVTVTQYTKIEFTPAMLVLWTAGSFVHALFDEFVWTVTSCACLLDNPKLEWMQNYRKYANVFVVLLITIITMVATLVVVIRATLDDDTTSQVSIETIDSESIEITKVTDAKNYEFLISYAVELALTWLFYWPLVATIALSGCLSCKGKIRFFGGRPYEVAQEEEKRKSATMSHNNRSSTNDIESARHSKR